MGFSLRTHFSFVRLPLLRSRCVQHAPPTSWSYRRRDWRPSRQSLDSCSDYKTASCPTAVGGPSVDRRVSHRRSCCRSNDAGALQDCYVLCMGKSCTVQHVHQLQYGARRRVAWTGALTGVRRPPPAPFVARQFFALDWHLGRRATEILRNYSES